MAKVPGMGGFGDMGGDGSESGVDAGGTTTAATGPVRPLGEGSLGRAVVSGVLDLESCSGEFQVKIAELGGKTCRITITPSASCTGTLAVKTRSGGGGAIDFATPKTLDLTAAADSEAIAEDELAGVEVLAIIGPAVAQAGKTVRVSVVVGIDR